MQLGKIDIAGIDDLDAQLARIGSAMATEIGERAVRESAEILAEGWEAAAPYDPRQRSAASRKYGHLRANIRVAKVKSIKASWIGYSVSTGRAFWANFLEFGTRFMAARPWARAALDRLRVAIVERQVAVINRGIAEHAAGKRGEK